MDYHHSTVLVTRLITVLNQVPDQPSRLDRVCAQCWTSEENVPDSVNVKSLSTTPICKSLPTGVTSLSDGVTLETLQLEEDYSRISSASRTILECYNGDACKVVQTPTNIVPRATRVLVSGKHFNDDASKKQSAFLQHLVPLLCHTCG